MSGAAILLLLVAGGWWVTIEEEPGGGRAVTDPPPAPTTEWLSGSAGRGVASGEFGAWRGRPLDIAATWADNNDAMVKLLQLRPDGEFAAWDKALDISIGAIGEGESWAEAADGAYDERWRESLTNLGDLWAGRSGTLYIRFAHEMNGDWFPWTVNAGNAEDFVASWKRFRALQQEIFPESELVFSVNRETNTGIDWRSIFPGRQYVDLMSVDYYNQYPYIDTPEAWDASIMETDGFGAPKGLQQHLDFARSVELPLGISEWSGNADNGDAPAFIQGMHDFVEDNAGDGAGEILYEIQFNVIRDGGRWHLFGEDTRMPESASLYRELW